MAAKDRELEAISAIMSQLAPLDEVARGRVLEYVLKRLDMRAVGPAREVGSSAELANVTGPVAAGAYVKDIRTLAAEKQPRSANEMVALIGYYLSELAPEDGPTRSMSKPSSDISRWRLSQCRASRRVH